VSKPWEQARSAHVFADQNHLRLSQSRRTAHGSSVRTRKHTQSLSLSRSLSLSLSPSLSLTHILSRSRSLSLTHTHSLSLSLSLSHTLSLPRSLALSTHKLTHACACHIRTHKCSVALMPSTQRRMQHPPRQAQPSGDTSRGGTRLQQMRVQALPIPTRSKTTRAASSQKPSSDMRCSSCRAHAILKPTTATLRVKAARVALLEEALLEALSARQAARSPSRTGTRRQ